MQYISTRGGIAPIAFKDAVMMGLATDGGLLLPETIPDVRTELADWSTLSYPELAYEVISRFVGDIPADDLRQLVNSAYATFDHPATTPVVAHNGVHILELFHGPTLAFKDVALQLLGNLFEYILAERGSTLNILGATSGDTGSAAIHGVRGRENINIFIMHPNGRTSPVQALQMTTVLDENVHNIAIEGTFDDGQRIMKELFADLAFKDEHRLGAVNSVNWARVLAQIVYYFYGAFRVQESTGSDRVRVTVPTGNFGDIFAGYVATRMGAPVSNLVLATNENDILARFFATGLYSRGNVHKTLSPSMDIQVASNFERYLYYHVGQDPAKLNALMGEFASSASVHVPCGEQGVDPLFLSGVGDTAATLTAIRDWHEADAYLLDPHTAVGVAVARELPPGDPDLCLATAHPAKFSAAIVEALGEDLAHHPSLDALTGLPTRCTVLPAENAAIRNFMEATLG
ncbi:MAG: threonine synthase [Rhodothermales bacterium]|jgi:threonine synthase